MALSHCILPIRRASVGLRARGAMEGLHQEVWHPPQDGTDRVSSVVSQIISHEGLIYIIQGECYVAQNKQ